MPTYIITRWRTQAATVTVVADDETEALALADEMFEDADFDTTDMDDIVDVDDAPDLDFSWLA